MKYERKEIPGFPDYYADTNSNIWSYKKHQGSLVPRKLKLCKNKKGYLLVKIGGVVRQVHRLILMTFIGKCPEGMQTCHNNGIKDDNRVENLRWDTPKNNCADRRKHGNQIMGEKHHLYGKKRSVEVKRKISLANKGKQKGKDNHFYGKKHTEETKLKMIKMRKNQYGENSPGNKLNEK